MTFKHNQLQYTFKRYPESTNRSLRPWSATDEYLLSYFEEHKIGSSQLAISHDRFGFLSTVLESYKPYSIISYASQEKAFRQNQSANNISFDIERWISPLDEIPKPIDIGIIRIPKSLDLFKLYLHQLSSSLADEGKVICSFMTRHFTPQMLSIAQEYFEVVEQSKAWKKARLLILERKKTLPNNGLLKEISDESGNTIRQYSGVFSADHVDYGTQFLLQNLSLQDTDHSILDLASGSGVIAQHIRDHKSEAELHLLDDFHLAVESSKLNVSGDTTYFHLNDSLELFQPNFFDLIVSNPPFHFEYETNIDISLKLFKEAQKCLKPDGRLVLVGNTHLNYKTHLIKLFNHVDIINENEKFVIYECKR